MKKIVTFASNVHASALLCCSAAVLLTACGGSTMDTPTATASTGVQSANVSEATDAAAAQVPALTEESAGSGTFEQASNAAATAPQGNKMLATVNSAATSVSDQVASLYRTLLNREPDGAGLQYWTQQANAHSVDWVRTAIMGSEEYQVIQMYATLLGRKPDSDGLAHWIAQMRGGHSADWVRDSIMQSQEYRDRQQNPAPGAPAPAPAAPDTSIYHLYVATNGSDSNTGTQAKPFKTIAKAAGAAKAGTTIHVAAGTYSGNVSTKTSGTSSNRIRFVSDTKWGAKVVGSGAEAMWTNSGNYVEINGFDITGPGRHGILNNGSNTLMTNNHIHNLGLSGGCTGGGGAGIVNANYSGSNGDVIGNLVHDIAKPGACNGVQGIYSANKGGKIMNNVVYRASSYGIHLWHAATDAFISNNTVFANGSSTMGGGIVIGAGDAPGGVQVKNTMVVNNIVYNNPRSGILQYCYSGQSCIGSGNVTANNLVYGNGSNISLKTGSATGTVSADPKFVSYNPTGTGDYRLQASSPAVNKGTSSWSPAIDILGKARPLGGAFDIGAYENY